jgi:tetratricopeptide (TPR) repeat protein
MSGDVEAPTADSSKFDVTSRPPSAELVRPSRVREAAPPTVTMAAVLTVTLAERTSASDDLEGAACSWLALLGRLVETAARRGGEVVIATPERVVMVFAADEGTSASERALDAGRTAIAVAEASELVSSVAAGADVGPVAVGYVGAHVVAVGDALARSAALATAAGQLRVTKALGTQVLRHVVLSPDGDCFRVAGHRAGLERLVGTSIGRAPLPFVGRTGELEQAEWFALEALRRHSLGLVRVSGPAGAGTSRFLAELAARVGRQETRLLVVGAAVSGGEHSEIDGLLRVVAGQARVRANEPEELAARRFERWLDADGTDARTLARMVAEGVDRVPATDRNHALVTALQRLGSTGPTLLLFDGQLELAGLRAVFAALGDGRSLGLVVLASGRAPAVESAGGAVRTLNVTLGPWSQADTEALVRTALAPALDIPRWLLREVVRLSDGLPLVVDELLLALEAAGTIDTATKPWRIGAAPTDLAAPTSLDHLALGRALRLVARDRRAADAAAVLGDTVTPEALAALGISDPRARLDALVVAGVLAQGADEQWVFTRSTMSEALRRALGVRRARRLHRAAGDWVARRANDPRAWALAAHHYALAGEADLALPFAERAAARAAETPRPTEAVARCRVAVELATITAQRSGTPEAGARLAEACVRLAEQLRRAGQLDLAGAEAKRAQLLADTDARRAEAHVALGWVLEHQGRLELAAEAFAAAYEVAEARSRTHSSAAQGLASVRIKSGQLLEALDLLASAAGDEPLIGVSGLEAAKLRSTRLRLEGHARLRQGQLADAERAYRAAVASALDGGAAEEEVDALNGLGALRFFGGDLAGAEAIFTEALHAAERWDLVHVEGYVQTNLAEAQLRLGKTEEAAGRLRVARARHTALGNDEGVAEAARLLAEALVDLGDLASATEAAAASTAAAERIGTEYARGNARQVTELVERAQRRSGPLVPG